MPLPTQGAANSPEAAKGPGAMATKEVESEVLAGYVRTILEQTGWSQNKLATRSGINAATISRMKNGERQTRHSTLRALETASRVPLPPELVAAGAPDMLPGGDTEKQDRVPVYAMIGSSSPQDWYRNETMPDAVARPPGLAEARAVYAFRMPDASMAPWRRPNELVFVNPHWAVAEGDHVLAELNHPTDQNHSRQFYRVRRFLGFSRNGRRLLAYATGTEETIPDRQVVNMYRILEWPEVLGIR